MLIHDPCIITPSLEPGVKVGDAFVSIEYEGNITPSLEPGVKNVYRCTIILPDGKEYRSTIIGGDSLQHGLATLLGFLGAAAESRSYRQRTGREGSNEDLFPDAVVSWASQVSDELGMLECILEETENLIDEG